jgi:glycosyltransferase involved in cell wall biosynthesis
MISVIIPAYNTEDTIRDCLKSAEDSIDYLRSQRSGEPVRVELVVVDDGSSDGTLPAILDLARGKGFYRVLHRACPSSPSCARNCGVDAASGDLICFLDADDLYLPSHLHECHGSLQDARVEFAKTGVAVSHPVHPDWRKRIDNSLVQNLCVRKRCHDLIGGLPDYHLCRRHGGVMVPELDIFRMIEDVYYNSLLSYFFRGRSVPVETVAYMRRPGNSFDKQYDKFQHCPGELFEPQSRDEWLKIKMSGLIIERLKHDLKATLSDDSQEARQSKGAI